ncbi:hypothetical protein OAE61_04350 [Verrucomicrobiales bacterium]|nr:hypothetical protein [Verrucomicrobiales bacterium]
MHGAAGRIEQSNLARVFDGAVRDVDGLSEEFLLAESFLVWRLGGGFALGKEDLAGAADEVAALVSEAGLAAAHLIPDAAEGVVGEELDDVAGGEELVADGEFAGVARGGGLLAHLFALLGVVVILVDPANGLVLLPESLEITGPKKLEQS